MLNKLLFQINRALVLNLVGDLVEQKREVNPMDTLLLEALDEKKDKPEVLLADVLTVIAKAKNDDRVAIIGVTTSRLTICWFK